MPSRRLEGRLRRPPKRSGLGERAGSRTLIFGSDATFQSLARPTSGAGVHGPQRPVCVQRAPRYLGARSSAFPRSHVAPDRTGHHLRAKLGRRIGACSGNPPSPPARTRRRISRHPASPLGCPAARRARVSGRLSAKHLGCHSLRVRRVSEQTSALPRQSHKQSRQKPCEHPKHGSTASRPIQAFL